MKYYCAPLCFSTYVWILVLFTAGSRSYPSVGNIRIESVAGTCTTTDHHLVLESGKNCTIQCSIWKTDDEDFILSFHQYEHIMTYDPDPILLNYYCDSEKCSGNMSINSTHHNQHINCLFIFHESEAKFYTNTFYVEVKALSSSSLPTSASSIVTSKMATRATSEEYYYSTDVAAVASPSPSGIIAEKSNSFCYCPSVMPHGNPSSNVTSATVEPILLSSVCLLLSSLLSLLFVYL